MILNQQILLAVPDFYLFIFYPFAAPSKEIKQAHTSGN
jgi:hypothetical protein